MPEGPSIVILRELVKPFKGKKILQAAGNAKIDMDALNDQKIVDFKSWGKHFLICLPGLTLRIHFLMFGSYSINEQTKPTSRLRLHLKFAKCDLYFYTCSVKVVEGDPDAVYDWSGDVMNEQWNPARAREKLKAMPQALVCDALLDQNVFAGVGNIIKNEVLFRVKVHPESRVGKLPPRKLTELIKEARNYSFDFLKWKKAFELRKHWQVYAKKTCPDSDIPIVKVPRMGKTQRRTFYCQDRQVLYK